MKAAAMAGLDPDARPAHRMGMNRPPDLSHRAVPGARLSVWVTPRAGCNALGVDESGAIAVRVTAAPEDGKANAAVRKLLAKALGVAPSRLTLVAGATARDKLFRID
jgi:uncharacterized protein YggU (UPF0235/DUF167 family)